MKRNVIILISLLGTIGFTNVSAEEVQVKILPTTIPASSDRTHYTLKASVSAIQIVDKQNGVVCYGLVPTSEQGKAVDGGYPSASISCVVLKNN